MTLLYHTGFEMGYNPVHESDMSDVARVLIRTDDVHTGTYALRVASGTVDEWCRFAVDGTPANVGVSVWINPLDTFNEFNSLHVALRLVTGEFIDLQWNDDSHTFDLYVDDVLTALGTQAVPYIEYFHLSFHTLVSNAGSVDVLIDGVISINYSGDTLPIAAVAQVDYVYFRQNSSNREYHIDDLAVSANEVMPDIRVDALLPSADDTAQWTPFGGGVNYDEVNSVPPNDATYVETDLNNQRDLYELDDWDDTDKSPVGVQGWWRVYKTVANTDAIEPVLESGATVDVGAVIPLATTLAYYYKEYDVDPNTLAEWTDAAIDAMKLGMDSVV